MFRTLPSSCRLGAFALTLTLASGPGWADEPVCASFDRLLAHRPAPGAAPAAAPGPADPLVAALVVPLRDGVRPAGAVVAIPAVDPATPSDPVAASFARMLAHAPSAHVPPTPAGTGPDPLIAALVRPLLQARLYTVAGAAASAPH